jgi:hypothetical protein
MPQNATTDDAQVIMQLYDLRREERLRKARSWFVGTVKGIRTAEEFFKLAPVESDENAFFRMVVTYWDMAAGFVNSGAVNRDLFFRSSNEMLFVWIRASALIAEMRKTRDNPLMFADLEQAANDMSKWLDSRAPGAFEGFKKMVLA